MFGKSIMHNISPGYHKQHHAVFLVSNVQERNISKKEATLWTLHQLSSIS